ncbi:hypothetical protein CHS0354_025246 [Potamilus streckersoni]|uniref:Uncharacterized protein n=1 Tax=Potamilus streckersoni TaxID=2493646 RepID=A0AAE0VI65_9BIVA|nr:hypothetical protein CHS0354_025246 [Potamilus streckersoni]
MGSHRVIRVEIKPEMMVVAVTPQEETLKRSCFELNPAINTKITCGHSKIDILEILLAPPPACHRIADPRVLVYVKQNYIWKMNKVVSATVVWYEKEIFNWIRFKCSMVFEVDKLDIEKGNISIVCVTTYPGDIRRHQFLALQQLREDIRRIQFLALKQLREDIRRIKLLALQQLREGIRRIKTEQNRKLARCETIAV